MKFAILAVCVAAVAAKPHVYLFNGPAPLDREGRVIETPEVAHARATHLAAVASASASSSSSSSSSFSSSSSTTSHSQGYQGPPAPLNSDGQVVDTAEVAQLKAERLAALNKATAEAQASAGADLQFQEVPIFVVMADHQRYSGPYAPIGLDGRVIETEEVATLKAEHLKTFAEAQARAAAFAMTSSSSSSAEGYSHEAPAIQQQKPYNGPPAPLGQDGRVIDTDEVAKLKAERIAALEKANAEAAASSAESSSSSEGYSYEVPLQKIQPAAVYGAPAIPAQPQQIYNGPPAPLGQDGRVIDTDEVAKLKAEHIATLEKANAEAALNAAESSSSEGYSYEAPAQKTIPAPTYGAPSVLEQPQQTYNGPFATIGPDGRVVDTEEVARLKAEHLATLAKANAEAAAIEAMEVAMGKSSSEGYIYNRPAVKHQGIPAPTYGAPVAQSEKTYNGPYATIGEDGQVIDTEEVAKLKAEHLATLAKANAEAAAIAAMEAAMEKSSTDGYNYETPAPQPQLTYNGPAAPLGQDGRVIDTDEVATLKAERIATLEKAHAEAAANSAASSSSSEGYHYEAPIQKIQAVPAPIYGLPVQKIQAIPAPTYGAPIAQPEKTYNGPFATIGQDGRVVDTEEVAKLKAEHLATLAKANAEAAAIEAMEAALGKSSDEGYHYEAPIQKTETVPARTYPVAQPQNTYNGPAAPLGQDGRVVDTDEVATLKAERIATLEQAHAAAAASEAASSSTSEAASTSISEGYQYETPIQKIQAIPAPTYGVPVQKIYNGPFATIGQDGRVVDTEEVAKLKAEHLATLAKANAEAAAIEAMEAALGKSSDEGYHYEAPIQKTEAIPAPTYGAPVAQPQKVYNGPAAPLGQDGRVIDTDEVATLKAERIATLEQAHAAAAASEAASSSTSEAASTSISEGYRYETPIQKIQFIPAPTYGVPVQKIYNGPFATIGQDGRVVDTEEVAKLKAEHLATLAKANAEAAAIEAMETALGKSSDEGYHYEAPIQKTEAIPAPTYGAPVAQPQTVYNGPAAPLGQDGRVIDTDEVATLKAERIATLEQAHAAAAASEAASSSTSEAASTSISEGYQYETPIQKIQFIPAPTYGVPVQKIYNGPFATIGQDGRVVDTEEVAKLKAEHLATLAKANAEAAAIEAMEAALGKTSDKGYHYEAPIQKTEAIPAPTYGAPVAQPQTVYTGPAAPLGEDGRVIDTDEVARLKAEHIATLEKANAAAAASSSAESISTSAEGYTYEAPIQKTEAIPASTYGAPAAQPQNTYNGPAAPLGEDGRVIDTDEVAKLKAEHIATLEKANAAAAASEAATGSSSEQGYSYEAPVAKLYLPAPAVPAETYGAPITKIQQTYGGPLAPLSQDGQVIDTQEVAQLKAEHLATLAQANARAEASAASASSSSSSSASSSVEVTYGAPAVQQTEPIIRGYSGPLAPLAADGTVLDTDEVARLKAEHLAALNKATAEAIAHASAEVTDGFYSPPLPAEKSYRGSFRGY